MKQRIWSKVFLPFLPLWLFGFAVLLHFSHGGIEFLLELSGNEKLLYAFQDDGSDYVLKASAVLFILSFFMTFVWGFLIHLFWREKKSGIRWTASIAYLLFPFLVYILLPNCCGCVHKDKAVGMICCAHMKIISQALWQYAEDNDDHYPASLEMLYPKYLPEKRYLQCPSAKKHSGVTDYDYFGKDRKTTDPVFIILEDKPRNHRRDFRNQADSEGCINPM